MKKFKGHNSDCRKSTGKTSSDTGIHIILCVCAITVLHECWMQDTATSHDVTWCNLVTIVIPISVPIHSLLSETHELKVLTSQIGL